MTTHADTSFPDLFADLTEPQKRAVLTTEGAVLVLAAAGSGKTRVITRRIAHLISMGVPAWSILALTFTNKAAGEMRERVFSLLGGPTSGDAAPSGGAGTPSHELPRHLRGLTITTFHSLCARLLRRYAEHAGLRPDYTIYDTSDQAALMKKCIEGLQLSSQNFPPRSVLSAISKAKNDLLDAEGFAARAYDFTTKNIAKIYSSYTRALRAANAVDFDDLLLLTAQTLRHDAGVRDECRRRWQYLLVDEYQDTNRAQFLIATHLVGSTPSGSTPTGSTPLRGVSSPYSSSSLPGIPNDTPTLPTAHNICVVGDPDQAIYGWRGADISNILDFEEQFPGCATITLGENFRSTAPILAVADTLIRNNKRRKHKDLFTSRKGGEKPQAVLCRDEHHESTLVADWFRSLHRPDDAARASDAPLSWKDMAVFYRTNALSRVVEDAFRSAGIPYTIARGTAFYEREEIKNAIGYLRVVANPADDVSLARIVNTPARGIGDTTFTRLEAAAARDGMPVLEILRDPAAAADGTGALSARAVNAISKFVGLVDSWTAGGTFMGSSVPSTLHELVDRVVKESGLEQMYKAQAAASGSESDAERLDNLAELVSSAAEFELEYDPAGDPALEPAPDGLPPPPPLLAMLRGYLESIALVADADAVDPSQGSVTLMTLHAAKGLEFPAVAIIGMEEGQMPHIRAISSASESELEEERRLAFVGITRAMRRLMMSAAKYRTQRGLSERTIPSRFLGEVPADLLLVSDQSESFADTSWDGDATNAPAHARGLTPGTEPKLTGQAAQFPVGSKVRHPQFGVGVVQSVTPGANCRATISFQGLGSKTLVLEYARLTRVP